MHAEIWRHLNVHITLHAMFHMYGFSVLCVVIIRKKIIKITCKEHWDLILYTVSKSVSYLCFNVKLFILSATMNSQRVNALIYYTHSFGYASQVTGFVFYAQEWKFFGVISFLFNQSLQEIWALIISQNLGCSTDVTTFNRSMLLASLFTGCYKAWTQYYIIS